MSFAIIKLPQLEDFVYHLDSPKGVSSAELGKSITVSGWVYSKRKSKLEIIIEENGVRSAIKLDRLRPDVSMHLEKVGYQILGDDVHGFSTTLQEAKSFRVGFKVGDDILWAYNIDLASMQRFNEADNLRDLVKKPEGVCGNVYFHHANDWSKVIILFNGALTPAKIKAEKAPFQRWSWAKLFKHPVFCVADPMTVGEGRLLLAWYLGDEGSNGLPDIIEPIIEVIKEIRSDAQVIGFGSSGGGFAAMGATMLGYLDRAIAVNPQTDALRFEVRSAVEAFLEKRNYSPCDSNLMKYDVSNIKEEAIITYVQNDKDFNHFNDHYQPFKKFCKSSMKVGQYRFIEYSDEQSGHNPPDLKGLCDLIGPDLSDMLVDN